MTTQRAHPLASTGLRAVFHTAEEEDSDSDNDDDDTTNKAAAASGSASAEPLTDSLATLWRTVSALHSSDWSAEHSELAAVPRPWKDAAVADALEAVAALTLPDDDAIGSSTVPMSARTAGPLAAAACMQTGVRDDGSFMDRPTGSVSPAGTLAYSYVLQVSRNYFKHASPLQSLP
jgi:hypothetical protein